jgi:hypothetical protein
MTQLNPSQVEVLEVAEAVEAPMGPLTVMFPHTYVWYVFVSALDVIFTAIMLHFNGQEVNILANWVLQNYDMAGMIVFKFVLVSFVICICEVVGRKRYRAGRELGHWAVGITCIPVILAILQLVENAPL